MLGLLTSTVSNELFSWIDIVDPVMMTVIVRMRKREEERGWRSSEVDGFPRGVFSIGKAQI
jgi:hypothetical protein